MIVKIMFSLARASCDCFYRLFLGLSLVSPAAAACDGRIVDSKSVLHAPLCVPDEPKRIVVLDATFNLNMALELGLPVVGAPLFGIQNPKLQAMAQEAAVTDIGSANEPSIERIIALQPDLILGDAAMHAQAYDLATQLAPTVLVNAQDWKEFFATIAAATGTSGKADEAFKAYEERAAEIKARMPDVKVSVLRVMPCGFHVYVDGPAAYAPFAVMHDAGVKRSAYETVTDATILKRPDWESLAQLDGDILLYMVGSPYDDESDGTLEAETLANPLWQMLPAVKAGRAYKVDIATWMAFGGLASANRILDDVERYVVAVSREKRAVCSRRTEPLRRSPASFGTQIGALAVTAALVVVVTAIWATAVGTASIPVSDVVGAFLAFDGSREHIVVLTLRLPRVLAGLAVRCGARQRRRHHAGDHQQSARLARPARHQCRRGLRRGPCRHPDRRRLDRHICLVRFRRRRACRGGRLFDRLGRPRRSRRR